MDLQPQVAYALLEIVHRALHAGQVREQRTKVEMAGVCAAVYRGVLAVAAQALEDGAITGAQAEALRGHLDSFRTTRGQARGGAPGGKD